jgi:hypothetical protein
MNGGEWLNVTAAGSGFAPWFGRKIKLPGFHS